jgi:hypothetical protein
MTAQVSPAQYPTFFHGTNNMDASNKLPYFPANFSGKLRVECTKGIVKRDGTRMYLAEFEVLTSNIPATIPVGGKYSWCQNMREEGTAYPACISFLWACLGLDGNRDRQKIETEIKPKQDAWLNSTTVPGNTVLVGAEVYLQTANKQTRADKPFTLHNFFPANQAA